MKAHTSHLGDKGEAREFQIIDDQARALSTGGDTRVSKRLDNLLRREGKYKGADLDLNKQGQNTVLRGRIPESPVTRVKPKFLNGRTICLGDEGGAREVYFKSSMENPESYYI